MKPKQAFILLAVVAVVVAIIFGVEALKKNQAKDKDKLSILFPGLDVEKADAIEILAGATSTVIVKKDKDNWRVETLKNYPASLEAVKRVLDAMKEIKVADLASNKPEAHERLGVDDKKGVILKLRAAGQPLAELVIGVKGANADTSFVRKPNANETYLVYQDLNNVISPVGNEWRDKQIFNFTIDDVAEVNLVTAGLPAKAPDVEGPEAGSTANPEPGATVKPEPGSTAQPEPGATVKPKSGDTAAKSKTDTVKPEPGDTSGLAEGDTAGKKLEPKEGDTQKPWTMLIRRVPDKDDWEVVIEGGSVESPDKSKVDGLVRSLVAMKGIEFADTVSPQDAGLDPPRREATFKLKNGETYQLLIGYDDGAKYFVKRADGDIIHRVYRYNVENVFKKPDALKPGPADAADGEMVPGGPMPPGMPGGFKMPPGMVMPPGAPMPMPPPPPAAAAPAAPPPDANEKLPSPPSGEDSSPPTPPPDIPLTPGAPDKEVTPPAPPPGEVPGGAPN